MNVASTRINSAHNFFAVTADNRDSDNQNRTTDVSHLLRDLKPSDYDGGESVFNLKDRIKEFEITKEDFEFAKSVKGRALRIGGSLTLTAAITAAVAFIVVSGMNGLSFGLLFGLLVTCLIADVCLWDEIFGRSPDFRYNFFLPITVPIFLLIANIKYEPKRKAAFEQDFKSTDYLCRKTLVQKDSIACKLKERASEVSKLLKIENHISAEDKNKTLSEQLAILAEKNKRIKVLEKEKKSISLKLKELDECYQLAQTWLSSH